MRSIYEDYLMTVDSFSAMYLRLNDNGMIRCSVALDAPLVGRFVFLLYLPTPCARKGITDPAKHLLVVRSWNLTLFLLSKSPFQKEELTKAAGWAFDNGFDTIFNYSGQCTTTSTGRR